MRTTKTYWLQGVCPVCGQTHEPISVTVSDNTVQINTTAEPNPSCTAPNQLIYRIAIHLQRQYKHQTSFLEWERLAWLTIKLPPEQQTLEIKERASGVFTLSIHLMDIIVQGWHTKLIVEWNNTGATTRQRTGDIAYKILRCIAPYLTHDKPHEYPVRLIHIVALGTPERTPNIFALPIYQNPYKRLVYKALVTIRTYANALYGSEGQPAINHLTQTLQQYAPL